MSKVKKIGGVIAGLLFVGILGSAFSQPQTSQQNVAPSFNTTQTTTSTEKVQKVAPICDGTTVTKDCTLEGITYSSYVYHPATEEQSHTETVTTYEDKVTGYCTLCNDGTYSPSCATGSGACSHHGGVAQWNAPRYSSVPVESTKKIVDAPAKEAYFEKTVK